MNSVGYNTAGTGEVDGDTIRDAGNLLLATSQQDFPVMHGNEVVGLLPRSALIRSMLSQGPDAYVAAAMDRLRASIKQLWKQP